MSEYKLITEDGVELSKGDKYYYVCKGWLGADRLSVFENVLKDDTSKVAEQIFADKTKAQEFIDINDKKYSWEDIEGAIKIMQGCSLTNKELREQIKHYLEN